MCDFCVSNLNYYRGYCKTCYFLIQHAYKIYKVVGEKTVDNTAEIKKTIL